MNLKKLFASFALFLICSFGSAQVVNIPDENFLEYLLLYHTIDTNNDGKIQVSEAESYTGIINVYNSKVTDLTGLEAFKNITALQIGKTQISQLDVSNNTKLQYIYTSSTLISKLDVSNNYQLIKIEATFDNNLTNIVFGSGTYNYLTNLDLRFNVLESLDVTRCPKLSYLDLLSNKLTSIDLTKNPRLAQLGLGSNLLTSLDVTHNTRLISMGIGLNQIPQIDLSNNPQLDILTANGNPITDIDLSHNIYLTQLLLESTKIEAIDVSKLSMLQYFYINFTPIKNIDVSKNTNLLALQASNCPNLETVNVKDGNNINFLMCVTQNNPKLTCIMVDNPDYSSTANLWKKDATATYTTDCALLATSEINTSKDLKVFPNPTQDLINLSEKVKSITVRNVIGQVIKTAENTNTVSLAKFPSGTYMITVQTVSGKVITKKIIKK